jgi:alkanesulfonate monooxygenase SsuD/methylene tetrahydromethanopterin reductase-like flavin-dependent oxidoreductase (luciferase family)
MATLGAIVLPHNPPEQLLPIARIADESGLDELWLWEDSFLTGGIASAAAALGATERLAVGVGVLPVPFRNVALTAMEIATLHRLFGDRAIIGIGHGVQEWMEQVGARAPSPLTLLREYTTALRELLSGAETSTDGRYVRLDRVRLAWPPSGSPDILLGAEGPKSKQLAVEVGDGIILVGGTTPADIAALPGSPRRIVVFVPTAFGADGPARLAAVDYRHGESGLAGSPAEVAEGARRWIEAGATTVVLQPLESEPDAAEFVRIAGAAVQPILRGAGA